MSGRAVPAPDGLGPIVAESATVSVHDATVAISGASCFALAVPEAGSLAPADAVGLPAEANRAGGEWRLS